MGIYCNLHITIEEIYKFVFLHVEYLFFFPWNLSCIFSFAVMWFGLFFLNEKRRKRIFSTHVWRERKRKTSRLLYRCISLVFSTRGTLFLRPYYLSVLSSSFELQSDNVNWNSCIIRADILLIARITTQLAKYPRVLYAKPSNKVYLLWNIKLGLITGKLFTETSIQHLRNCWDGSYSSFTVMAKIFSYKNHDFYRRVAWYVLLAVKPWPFWELIIRKDDTPRGYSL